MSTDDINKILRSPDGGIGDTSGVEGVLARLWRQILFDLGIKSIKFNTLVYEASIRMNRQNKRYNDGGKVSKIFNKGNITRELCNNKLTFKKFITGLRVLKIVKVKLSVELTDSEGKVSIHGTSVDLGGYEDLDD